MDLTRSDVDIVTSAGTADAYFVHPSTGPHPAVLVFMDAIGLRPRMQEMADRVAERGYAVLVPNLFYRGGRAPVVPNLVERLQGEDRATVFEELRPHMAALTPEVAASDIATYVGFLDAQPSVAAGALATVGYCMGGALALRAAAQFPERVAAVASFHGGRLATDDPTSPHTLAGRIQAEVYAGHADNDASMPAEQIERFEQAMRNAGVTLTSELYVGASHGWTMSDMAVHDVAAEERHWDALFELLGRKL